MKMKIKNNTQISIFKMSIVLGSFYSISFYNYATFRVKFFKLIL